MSLEKGLLQTLQIEIDRAHQARKAGNEGKVRVSARRAAGQAIRAYLEKEGKNFEAFSALDYIEYMASSSDVSEQARAALSHLSRRVVKDSPEDDSYWPLDVDVIAETRAVIEELLGLELK